MILKNLAIAFHTIVFFPFILLYCSKTFFNYTLNWFIIICHTPTETINKPHNYTKKEDHLPVAMYHVVGGVAPP